MVFSRTGISHIQGIGAPATMPADPWPNPYLVDRFVHIIKDNRCAFQPWKVFHRFHDTVPVVALRKQHQRLHIDIRGDPVGKNSI